MSKRRNILLAALAGLILIPVLLMLVARHDTGEHAVRQKLNQLLGQTQPAWPDASADSDEDAPAPAPEQPPSPTPGSGGNSFFGLPFPMPQAGVDVQETPDSYILRIPLADPQDASSIKLNVTPHRIEVSGQTGTKEDGASVSSSFMQAFSTSQEVLPGQVTRQTEQNGDHTDMVITIPKKQATAGSGDPSTDTPGGNDAPPQDNSLPPLPPPNSLDNMGNRVI